MNIDDLKSGWQVLNNRLAETEKLNKRIIKEMIRKRTVTAYKRILYFDVIGTLLAFMMIVWFSLELFRENPGLSVNTLYMLISLMVIALAGQSLSFYYLSQFNIQTDKLVESGIWMIKYRLWSKKGTIFGGVVFIALVIACFIFEHARFSLTEAIIRCSLGFLLGIVLGGSVLYLYKRNFQELEEGLKELEELEKDNMENQ